MKRKVIRVCSLVLLTVAVSTTLVGCGSKSEKDTAVSSTTSTSKVVKSSAKTKTSEKKSAKKAKTEASASKDSQGQEEVSAPESSSAKTDTDDFFPVWNRPDCKRNRRIKRHGSGLQ